MKELIGAVSIASSAGTRRDDNFTDRLSNRYTVALLVASGVIVTASMYVGKAITCWAPKHFSSSHVKYANSYCWVRDTYYVPWDQRIPRKGEARQVIPYYQWIPFILLGQAILFYLPKVLWNGLNQKVGVDADNILEAASKFTSAQDPRRKDTLLGMVTNQLHRCLTARAAKFYKGWQCNVKHLFVKLLNPCGKRFGNYLSMLYLFCKLCYIANVVGQLLLLNSILATDYHIYGIQALDYLVHGKEWTAAPHVAFPRVTYCDFNIRRLGNVHRYTVQCLLPINMYTEKIYMFLWFWMAFVAICTCIDFLTWLARYVMHDDKVKFIANHLSFLKTEKDKRLNKKQIGYFVELYLKQDGVFLLRLIGQNTSNMTVTEITNKLWDKWNGMEKNKKKEEPDHYTEALIPSSPDSMQPFNNDGCYDKLSADSNA